MAMLVRVCSASQEAEGCRSSKEGSRAKVGWGWAVKESFRKKVVLLLSFGDWYGWHKLV